ncbi:MAG TPA: pyruvate, phosphate dikinase [Kofleriaceae bacterium]|nr:pyruvate, phosphate dikinase [Kofleriaceae bacterium]
MKHLRQFGGGSAEGRTKDKALLGGKGANLAEMAALGLPVPPGFTITTEVCRYVMEHGADHYPDELAGEVDQALARVEQLTGTKFGDPENPLLVSVRSGAAASMPGMMDTILNLGLNDRTVEALARQAGNPQFAWDCYRRFVAMYGEVVMGVVAPSEQDELPFDTILDEMKRKHRANRDQDLTEAALRETVQAFKAKILELTKTAFPDDVRTQLWGAIGAVFRSWNNPRAEVYRRMHHLSATMGTAVNVQAMVFGNLGEDCATGVAFTRNPATGTKELYGEFLTNAQGEDVVAGIRTPEPLSELAKRLPAAHAELVRVAQLLEDHFRDMQDLEFTIQRGQLFMLQTRTGKRTGKAMVKVAVDLVGEGKIDPREAVLRIDPNKLDEVLHPTIDPKARTTPVGKGLAASPGAAIGRIVFTATDAEQWAQRGERVLLVRTDTSPEDIHGMKAAAGILTARGGLTCIAGETQVLTDEGLMTAEAAFLHIEQGAPLRIMSVDSRTLQPVWREVIAAGHKPSEVITVAVSQTGRADQNTLRLTDDHKMYVIRDRQLVKKPLRDVLAAEDFVLAVDRLPGSVQTHVTPALAYVAGAIMSDGHVQLRRTKGSVRFIQKPTEAKAAFIETVERLFIEAFEVPFSYKKERTTTSVLRGREIRGSVQDLICSRRAPAERLAWIRDHLPAWVMAIDPVALRYFLAGYVDGDGSYAKESSPVRLQITVSAAKPNMLVGVVLACLRLGILPQVTSNRDAFNVQLAENVEQILAFTQRVHADIPERTYESKCLTVRGLFADIVDDVNFMGRVREGIKRNLMFGVEKIRRDVLPLAHGEAYRQLEALLGSALRSYRIEQVGDKEPARVYNFEVDADDELDKNYVVFSSRLTPILVSNSHAAVVARGMGKCCITACTSLRVDAAKKTAAFVGGGKELKLKEGDTLTLDGSTGEVFTGSLPLVPAQLGAELGTLMQWVDQFRTLKVRTNADTPTDARTARSFGAEGIGLCRTEHMFFQPERILAVREMIVAADEAGRRAALAKILPMQRADFVELFRVMDGLPVTIRLLDPPLHEFLPHTPAEIEEVARDVGRTPQAIAAKVSELTEANPMLGHRGCRLGITFPEIYEIQTEAIGAAAAECAKAGIGVHPEIMIPLVMAPEELRRLRALVAAAMDRALAAAGGPNIPYTIGTMIELPRACVVADRIAEHADFFSFGTNDLTQTTFGLSRDDAGRFLPVYLDGGVLPHDPFAVLDPEGVGALIELGVRGGRGTKPNLKVGICGEHGGEPSSVELCHRMGFDYVSCSPFRVPIARVAAAKAALSKK